MRAAAHGQEAKKRGGGCADCAYHGYAGGQVICEYILHTKKRRPCPVGPECTAFVRPDEAVGKKRPRDIDPDYMWGDEKLKTREWDTERAKQLFEEGKTDLEIAEMVGTTKSAISVWRNRAGLARKRGTRKTEEPAGTAEDAALSTDQPEETVTQETNWPLIPEPVAVCEREDRSVAAEEAQADPAEIKGLKLNLTLGGCEVELWADSLAEAVRGCRLALKMLQGGAPYGDA